MVDWQARASGQGRVHKGVEERVDMANCPARQQHGVPALLQGGNAPAGGHKQRAAARAVLARPCSAGAPIHLPAYTAQRRLCRCQQPRTAAGERTAPQPPCRLHRWSGVGGWARGTWGVRGGDARTHMHTHTHAPGPMGGGSQSHPKPTCAESAALLPPDLTGRPVAFHPPTNSALSPSNLHTCMRPPHTRHFSPNPI